MQPTDVLQAIAQIANGIGTVAVLLFVYIQERRRYDELFESVLEDWKRQNDREVTGRQRAD